MTEILKAKGNIDDVKKGGLYNPWVNMYKKGIGTLAYQDAWGLFDQIMINYNWLPKDQPGYFFYQQHIFNKEYMVENIGRYKVTRCAPGMATRIVAATAITSRHT